MKDEAKNKFIHKTFGYQVLPKNLPIEWMPSANGLGAETGGLSQVTTGGRLLCSLIALSTLV